MENVIEQYSPARAQDRERVGLHEFVERAE
jgi:hypothetical protein